MKVFVLGNGLSIAPTDGRLNVADITAQLWEWLEQEGLKQFVEELQEWAKPQMVGLDPNAHTYDFELVAGSLHRLGQAVSSLNSLGLAEWDGLNAMASALCQLHATETVAIYTLNYDSLLMSSLLEQTPRVYDGFRGRELNDPLDPWNNIALYPLHGSIGIYSDAAGDLSKRTLQEVRDAELLERWAAGEDNGELPQVVLGDTKDTPPPSSSHSPRTTTNSQATSATPGRMRQSWAATALAIGP